MEHEDTPATFYVDANLYERIKTIPHPTTPLNWREHMTEEEAHGMSVIDRKIELHRQFAADYTAARETIRRRITSRVRWERTKAMREAGK